MSLCGSRPETWFKCRNFKNRSHHGLAQKIWHEQGEKKIIQKVEVQHLTWHTYGKKFSLIRGNAKILENHHS